MNTHALVRSFAIAALLLLLPGPSAAADCPGYEGITYCGELTGDCKITTADALRALRIAVDQIPFDARADVNGNGDVTTADALVILRIAVGSSEERFVCDPHQVVLEPVDSGFYTQAGGHTSGNYAAGWFLSAGVGGELRDYFIFDLSDVDGTITAATLRLSSTTPGFAVYNSPDPSETFTLFSVTTPTPFLASGDAGTAGFADLGSGDVYGSFVATPSLGEFASINFEQAGRDALNETEDQIAIGGAITTLTKGQANEHLFNSTSESLVRRLILTIE